MKEYKIILKDKREAFIIADDHRVVDGLRKFFLNRELIPDVFFKEEHVWGVTIENPDVVAPGMAVG